MGFERAPLSDGLRDELDRSQSGRCALCAERLSLEAHHILPVRLGGLTTFENLVLLCPNHHELADSGALPPSLLRYYKSERGSGDSFFEADSGTLVYELSATQLKRTLLRGFDQAAFDAAFGIVTRLRSRNSDRRVANIYLELAIAIAAGANLAPRYARQALRICGVGRKAADSVHRDASVNSSELLLYEGALNHKLGNYSRAADCYEAVLRLTDNSGAERPPAVTAVRTMADVHLVATAYRSGAARRAFSRIEQVLDSPDIHAPCALDARLHGYSKRAEHLLVMGDGDKAYDVCQSNIVPLLSAAQPIYRAVGFKDLACVALKVGDSARALGYFTKAATVCQEFGFEDQLKKVLRAAATARISSSDLLLMDGYPESCPMHSR